MGILFRCGPHLSSASKSAGRILRTRDAIDTPWVFIRGVPRTSRFGDKIINPLPICHSSHDTFEAAGIRFHEYRRVPEHAKDARPSVPFARSSRSLIGARRSGNRARDDNDGSLIARTAGEHARARRSAAQPTVPHCGGSFLSLPTTPALGGDADWRRRRTAGPVARLSVGA